MSGTNSEGGALCGRRTAASKGCRHSEPSETGAQKDRERHDNEQAGPPGRWVEPEYQTDGDHSAGLQTQYHRPGQDWTQEQDTATDRCEQQFVKVAAFEVAHQVLGRNARSRH